MFCPRCGAATESTALFCRSCGKALAPLPIPAALTGAAVLEAPSLVNGLPMRGAVLPANAATFGSLPAREREVVYAGVWRRFAAVLIDSIVLGVIAFIIGLVVGVAFALAAPGSNSTAVGVAQTIGFLVGTLYYPLLESSPAQATWGKGALGIMVTDLGGGRISFWRAMARNLGKWISALLMCAGYLMAAFTQRKQALHDLMASTLVVVGSPRDAR